VVTEVDTPSRSIAAERETARLARLALDVPAAVDVVAVSRTHLPTAGAMRTAIDEARFTVHYQPQIDLTTGEILSVEALARWRDEQHGTLLPQHFLGVVEEAGVGAQLTDFVLDRLVSHLVLWRRFNFRFNGSFNVPAEIIGQPGLADTLLRKVTRQGMRPEHVTIEVDEDIVATEDVVVIENLMQLCMKGFGVALDAFGAGEGRRADVERLPLTQLKVDRTFLKEAANRPRLRTFLQTSLAAARRAGLRAVAIGVERDAEWKLLSQLGFDAAQGFLFAHPMPAEALPDWVVGWKRRRH